MTPSAQKRWPLCAEAGLLRQTRKQFVVSSAALYELWGNDKYQKTIPHLKYHYFGGWEPDSVEPLLNGKDNACRH